MALLPSQTATIVQVPNQTGAINLSSTAKTSRQIPVVLPAAVSQMGSSQPSEFAIMFPGTKFYVLACSAPLTIRSVRGGNSSAANVFGLYQGQPIKEGFDSLIVSNPSANPVVGLIWVGFDDFINDQVTLVSNNFQQIAYPTQPNPAFAGAAIQIPDLSGTTFFDVNGAKWGAIQRVAILVFNTSTGTTLALNKYGSNVATANQVGVIQPLQPIRFDFGGNYTISNGATAVPAIVSEIYNAFPAN